MEQPGHLHGPGCADAGSRSVSWSTVTADDLDARVPLEPCARSISFTIR